MVYRIDDTTAVSSPPPIPSDNIGQPGFFTGGSTSGQSATRVRFWWLNMIQEELVAFASAAGLVLDKSNNAQTLAAARILFAAAERGVAPYSAPLAQLIGGYPKYAIVVDATGVLWRSTTDANMTVPGADGANWVLFFDGLAEQSWANNRFATIDSLSNEVSRATKAENALQSGKVSKSGDIISGALQVEGSLAVGVNSGWSGGTEAGDKRWVNGHIGFGSPDGSEGAYTGYFQITDLLGSPGDDYSGINLFGFNYAGVRFDWMFSWNGNITTPKGKVAFIADLPSSGAIPGGYYEKTGNLLKQFFSVQATNGTSVVFPFSYPGTPKVSLTARHDGNSNASIIVDESGETLSGTGVVLDLRSLTGGGGEAAASSGYTGTTLVYVTVVGLLS